MGASGDAKKKLKTIKTDVQKGLFNNKICEIKNINKGLGVFCKILSPDKKEVTPALITSYQLLEAKDVSSGKKIEFVLNNETHSITIDESRKVYCEKEQFNITIIEIKKEDNLDTNTFFDIEIGDKKMDSSYLKKRTMVLIGKNYDNKLDTFTAEYKNLNKNGYEIEYKCDLNEEVYGCPLINVDNNKIIAFHTRFIVMDDICQGALMEDIVKEFNTIKEEIGDFNLDEDKKVQLKNSIRLSRLKTVKSIRVQSMKNDVILTYLIPPYGFKVKIFGEKFVKNNIDRCYFLLQDVKTQELFEFQLGAYLRIDQIPISDESMKVFRLILIQTDYIYDLSDMFYQCEFLLDASEINKLNTEQCMDMTSMFEGCKLLSGLSNIGDLDVSQVKNMSLVFDKCFSLQHLDLSKWKTGNVKSFKGMFEYCELLKTVKGLDNWDVSGLKDASFMFNICRSLVEIPDISNWNTYHLSNLSYMFQDCLSLKKIPDISKWTTKNARLLTGMFYNCINLESLPDISKWDMGSAEDLSKMFGKLEKIKSLPDISNWNITRVKNMSLIFENCHLLTELPDISKWNIVNVQKINGMFFNCDNLK